MTRPPKHELLKLLPLGTKRVAKRYGVSMSAVRKWCRHYDMDTEGNTVAPLQCQNPHCGQFVSQFLSKGECEACASFHYRHGRLRTEADMMRSKVKWCKRCKETKAADNGYCDACRRYMQRTGKERPWYLIRKGPCLNCGTPYQKYNFGNGECKLCRYYRYHHGVARPSRFWKVNCDCGHVATHLDVPLPITTRAGLKIVEYYNLYDSCFELERSRDG